MAGSRDSASPTGSLDHLAALVGENSSDGLGSRIRQELGFLDDDSAPPPLDELIPALAEREGMEIPGSDLSILGTEAVVQLATALDKRVPVMLSVWSHLEQVPTTPVSHHQVMSRVHEDERFLNRSAPRELPDLVLSVMKACDPDVSDDDLDEFLEDDQPTLFCYEMIHAHIEDHAERESASHRDEGEHADQDIADSQDAEDDFDDIDASGPVRASVQTFLVKNLYEYVQENLLNLQPPWQRKDVWSRKKKRELIRSLLLGIPLPSIILHKSGEQISIIDGKQRLTAIMQFMRNEFKLPSFDVRPSHPLHECRGAWYRKEGKRSLPAGRRLAFELREVPALLFEDVPDGRLRQIFHLYNVSGTRLNPAEIRNAVYQSNRIHQTAYVLGGEARPTPDLGTGDYQAQLDFTERLRATLPNVGRYAAVAFICRYLGYSRAAQRDPGQPFTLASTSSTINRYFDYGSSTDEPASVANEIIRVFSGAEQLYDIDDERLPFYHRNARGERKFNALVATTNMIAARLLLDAVQAGLVSEEDAQAAARSVVTRYPENQQTSTIWDYQARALIGLRDQLRLDPANLPGEHWAQFFGRMAFALLPVSEEGV